MTKASADMAPTWKEGNKLNGETNFKAWKKRINLILEEHDVLQYVKEKVYQVEYDVGKARVRKGEVKS